MATHEHASADPGPEQAAHQREPQAGDLVAVMVPAEYVPHVARLIAELDSTKRPLPPPDRRTLTREPQCVDWPVEELRRLSLGRSRTHRTVVQLMDFLAAQPEQFHRVADIVTALRLPPEAITGAMAGLTRIVKAHHNFPAWGLPVRRRIERQPGQWEQVYYSVSADQARRWNLVRRHDTTASTCADQT